MLTTWQEELFTTDASSSLRVFQPVKFQKNQVLDIARINLVCIGNPAFTSAFLEIYSYDSVNEVPKKLLHTSTNVVTKAQMMTLSHGVYDMPFFFNSPVFKENETYAFVMRLNGYTYSENSYVGWRKDFPDPVYKTNNPYASIANVGNVSYSIQFIGSLL